VSVARLFGRLGLALVSLGLVSCQRNQLPIEPGVSVELAEYRAAVVSAINYRLHLDIPEDQAADIAGRIVIDFQLRDTSQPLQLDFREAADRLRSVAVNGRDVNFRFRDEHLVIPRKSLARGGNRIEIGFLAGSSSLNRNPDFLYSLFVPDRARTAFPLFDQPDLKATWELSLAMPADWAAMSSAPVARVEVEGDRSTVYFRRSGRLSSYLFSFVAGKFKSIDREVDGRPMQLLHRETDQDRISRNIDEIFRLHADALAWLEAYTGIEYPFEKFGFALLPSHPYGGMEHVGAIQYRAETLWLDEAPSDTDLLRRAALIAHETAHMWFGNLVTMRWFDDVWTKEVFANFMAARIVNPTFPSIDHDLNFLVSHHPGAYSVDRTPGANPIRQHLANLNQAGQLYGAIIYDKAPIMMRQLEALVGEDTFREGIREYLGRFSHSNATWPELIEILDEYSEQDVAVWSDTWVNSAGRPRFELGQGDSGMLLEQRDPNGMGRLWPQVFSILELPGGEVRRQESLAATASLPRDLPTSTGQLVFNADGRGYGLFPADIEALAGGADMDDLSRASLLINLYEQMLEAGQPRPGDLLLQLVPIIESSSNQLLLDLALGQLRHIYWTLLPAGLREELAPDLEQALWQAMLDSAAETSRKIYFTAFSEIALTTGSVQRIRDIWGGDLVIENLPLAERDLIRLTRILAIKRPEEADTLVAVQMARTMNPDEQRRFAFMAPSLSADPAVRDAFFASLSDDENRQTESWVLDALGNLHHPLRVRSAEAYVLPSLELLEEIQATGDIFFPTGWLRQTLGNHTSDHVANLLRSFLEERPDYNPQLRMKILQQADTVWRANRLRKLTSEAPGAL
jgi:aminopeptidase N